MGGGGSKNKYIDPEEETRRLLDGEDADGRALGDDSDSDDSEAGEVAGARTLDLRVSAQQRQLGEVSGARTLDLRDATQQRQADGVPVAAGA